MLHWEWFGEAESDILETSIGSQSLKRMALSTHWILKHMRSLLHQTIASISQHPIPN